MSSKKLFILQTPGETGNDVYRLTCRESIKELNHDTDGNELFDYEVMIIRARMIWAKSKVFTSKQDVIEEASKQLAKLKNCDDYVETIYIPYKF